MGGFGVGFSFVFCICFVFVYFVFVGVCFFKLNKHQQTPNNTNKLNIKNLDKRL